MLLRHKAISSWNYSFPQTRKLISATNTLPVQGRDTLKWYNLWIRHTLPHKSKVKSLWRWIISQKTCELDCLCKSIGKQYLKYNNKSTCHCINLLYIFQPNLERRGFSFCIMNSRNTSVLNKVNQTSMNNFPIKRCAFSNLYCISFFPLSLTYDVIFIPTRSQCFFTFALNLTGVHLWGQHCESLFFLLMTFPCLCYHCGDCCLPIFVFQAIPFPLRQRGNRRWLFRRAK